VVWGSVPLNNRWCFYRPAKSSLFSLFPFRGQPHDGTVVLSEPSPPLVTFRFKRLSRPKPAFSLPPAPDCSTPPSPKTALFPRFTDPCECMALCQVTLFLHCSARDTLQFWSRPSPHPNSADTAVFVWTIFFLLTIRSRCRCYRFRIFFYFFFLEVFFRAVPGCAQFTPLHTTPSPVPLCGFFFSSPLFLRSEFAP